MGRTIVIAEDEAHIARLITFKLEREGFTVHWGRDGMEGYTLVERHKPDLVLLDIMMPVMDGYEVLRKIKDNDDLKDIPVIMLTAKGQERDIVKGLEKGSEDYIVKPFSPVELMARIHKVLNKQ